MAVTQSTSIVIKMSAAADAVTGIINVNFLLWHSPTANAGDTLLVKDAAGNVLWADNADGTYYKNFCPLKNRVNGITITTMTSGTLYVYKAAELPGQY